MFNCFLSLFASGQVSDAYVNVLSIVVFFSVNFNLFDTYIPRIYIYIYEVYIYFNIFYHYLIIGSEYNGDILPINYKLLYCV